MLGGVQEGPQPTPSGAPVFYIEVHFGEGHPGVHHSGTKTASREGPSDDRLWEISAGQAGLKKSS